MMRSWLILIIFLLMSGCALKSNNQFKAGGIDLFEKNPEKQLVLFISPDDQEHFCITPAPDAIESDSVGFNIGLTANDSISDSISDNATVLGGRTSQVLLARELFFRNCELAVNLKLSKEETLNLHYATLKLIRQISSQANQSQIKPISNELQK